jgi:8-oxo-dGTP pyrophosphatase MutT (NUDIX family)
VPSPPADSPADASADALADAAADAVADAVVIRPAATVMLVRDATGATSEDDRLEVLMVRRNLRSDFVGGAYVFPGGSVDPADAGPAAEAACFGRTDADASALLGIGTGGLAYWVAVLRETFEEAGLLLAERPGGPALLAGDPEEEARFVSERAAVNAGVRLVASTPASSWPLPRPASMRPTMRARPSPRPGYPPAVPWRRTGPATSS